MSRRDAMFRTAGDYHAALAAYSRAFRRGEEIEHVAQHVVAAGLHYRLAIDQVMAHTPEDAASQRRLRAMRKLLHLASWKYNTRKAATRAAVLQAR